MQAKNKLDEFLANKLRKLKDQDQYRTLTSYPKDHLDFSSNDYLGLAKRKVKADSDCAGSTGSRLITGNHKIFEDLEKDIADWKKTEAALFFGSGYLANLGTIAALAGPRDVIFSDELNHSCILDGIRLSGAKKFFYRNLDTQHLQELLEKHRGDFENAFVITDSIFSMHGTKADLKGIAKLKTKFDFSLYIDEAHATGTYASNGAGLYADLVEKGEIKIGSVDIQMGTFSKACGAEGAYIAGSKTLIDFLINSARTFIYSTAPSPVSVSLVKENLSLLINAKEERKRLNYNIEYFSTKLKELGLNFSNDKTAIFLIKVKNNKEAIDLSQKFLEKKILIKAIRPPTTPEPGLRICLHAAHTKDEMDRVLAIASPTCPNEAQFN